MSEATIEREIERDQQKGKREQGTDREWKLLLCKTKYETEI